MGRPRNDGKILVEKAYLEDLRKRSEAASVVIPTTVWEGKRVCLCTPWYKTTNPATAVCIGAMLGRYGLQKIGWQWRLGDAMIYHSRNYVADLFLKSDAEWSFWVDDDIIFPVGNAKIIREFAQAPDNYPESLLEIDTLQRLMSHNQKVVSGMYFGRNPKGKAQFEDGQRPQMHRQVVNPNFLGLIKTGWVATGLLLVHRDVFLAIRERFPEIAPGNRTAPEDGYKYHVDYWDYFGPLPGRGEDVSFCTRARLAGFDVFLDTAIRAFHVGYACYNWHNVSKDFK